MAMNFVVESSNSREVIMFKLVSKYAPVPSASRAMLVNNLLDYKLIDFNYIISNNSLKK